MGIDSGKHDGQGHFRGPDLIAEEHIPITKITKVVYVGEITLLPTRGEKGTACTPGMSEARVRVTPLATDSPLREEIVRPELIELGDGLGRQGSALDRGQRLVDLGRLGNADHPGRQVPVAEREAQGFGRSLP